MKAFWSVLAAVILAFFVVPLQPASAAVPAPPKVGACHTYTWTTYLGSSDSSAPVSCTGTYVAKTVYVGTLASTQSYTNYINDGRVWAYITNQCTAPTVKAVGSWYRLVTTGYNGAAFVPTQAQYQAGARWFRCDVLLPGWQRLFALRHQVPLASSVTSGQAACIHVDSAGYGWKTACASSHTYRVAATYTLTYSARPSNQTLHDATMAKCKTILHATDVWSSWPGSAYWAHGDRYAVCFKHTTA